MNRTRGLEMLREIKRALKQYYFDRTFGGIDLDARFKVAEAKIQSLETNSQIFQVIAAAVLELGDPDTHFRPPTRAHLVNYGFSSQFIGNTCYVIMVTPGSDAEKQGIKTGDILVGIDDFNLTRDQHWMVGYMYYALDPREKIALLLLNDDRTERTVEITASFVSIADRASALAKRRKETSDEPYRCRKINTDTVACRLDSFYVEKLVVDRMMAETAGFKKLILDLRGNSGGHIQTEEYLLGHFFDREVKIGTAVMREKSFDRIVQPQRKNAFGGELLVLTDSGSGGASEVVARVVQLEDRGKIVGDMTPGWVKTTTTLGMIVSRGTANFQTVSDFALSVSIGELIMTDGKSLDRVGVIPDHPVGPTQNGLRKGDDPVLAYAAELLGARLTTEEARAFQFLRKRSEDEKNGGGTKDGNP